MTAAKIPIAILAGGLATRMGELTAQTPKALLPVAGRPFIAHQLELLRERGARRVVMCVGHFGEKIEAFVKDGAAFGIEVKYSYDGPKLLGTGGALKQALPLLGERFFVLYGDSYLPIDLDPVAAAFVQSGKAGLMTVYRNENAHDTSNVWMENGIIRMYDKKVRLPLMRHIDYGLGLLRCEVFATIGSGERIDLADIYRQLVARGELAAYEVAQRFYEIGSVTGLEELDQLLEKKTE